MGYCVWGAMNKCVPGLGGHKVGVAWGEDACRWRWGVQEKVELGCAWWVGGGVGGGKQVSRLWR